MKEYDIGILCAIDDEFNAVKDRMTFEGELQFACKQVALGTVDGAHIVAILSDLGNVNAALATTLLIERFKPKFMLFSGIAGSLNQNLGIGDVLVGRSAFLAEAELTYSRMEGLCKIPRASYDADSDLLATAESLYSSCEHAIKSGVIATSDYFPAPVGFEGLTKTRNPDGIDMETFAFYRVCNAYSLPCLCIRGLSNPVNSHEQEEIQTGDIRDSSENAADFCFMLIAKLAEEKKAERRVAASSRFVTYGLAAAATALTAVGVFAYFASKGAETKLSSRPLIRN